MPNYTYTASTALRSLIKRYYRDYILVTKIMLFNNLLHNHWSSIVPDRISQVNHIVLINIIKLVLHFWCSTCYPFTKSTCFIIATIFFYTLDFNNICISLLLNQMG